MDLSRAVEVLKNEKRIAEIYSESGRCCESHEAFIEAADVILEFVDKCVSLLMR